MNAYYVAVQGDENVYLRLASVQRIAVRGGVMDRAVCMVSAVWVTKFFESILVCLPNL